MKQIVPKHPRLIRWTHWINFPVLFGMIYTGLMIYWANDEYRIGWGHFTLFHFFPNWFYNLFGLTHHLATGMAWHFFLMWIFAATGLVYFVYSIVSGEWRYLFPDRHAFRDAVHVTLYDLGLRKELPVQGRFNGAQKITYTAIVFMGFGSLLTGLAIYKPVQVGWLRWMLGGYAAARMEHFILTLGYVAFTIIHVAQVVRAGWNNLRSMISGYEIVEQEVPDVRADAETVGV